MPDIDTTVGSSSLPADSTSRDVTKDVEIYLKNHQWVPQDPGPGGALWRRADTSEIVIGLPNSLYEGTTEWHGVISRLSDFERSSPRVILERIRGVFTDVTRLRAANDYLIGSSIPLGAGVSLVETALRLVRTAATTSLAPKGHIGSSYSKIGDDIASRARMGHTERGSYILPVLMPLTPPKEEPSDLHAIFPEMESLRRLKEPDERRVTRTLAQALRAVYDVIVQPEKEASASELHDLVVAGGSRELVVAVQNLLKGSSVSTFEADFSWASGIPAPADLKKSVVLEAAASERLDRAARQLKQQKRIADQLITGRIVEIRHVPGDPTGEVSIDTVRRGRRCEVRVRLGLKTLNRTWDWARREETVIAEGRLRSEPGRPLRMDDPTRFVLLKETLLPDTEESTG